MEEKKRKPVRRPPSKFYGKNIEIDSLKPEEVLFILDSGSAEHIAPSGLKLLNTKNIEDDLVLEAATGEIINPTTIEELLGYSEGHEILFRNVIQGVPFPFGFLSGGRTTADGSTK